MFCILDNDRMTVCSSSGINNSTEEAHDSLSWMQLLSSETLPRPPILEAPPPWHVYVDRLFKIWRCI
jgi:hypothetical protein